MPFEEVVELIEKAYGKPWDMVFKKLEKSCKPASLGQVHFGKLKDGTEVAVKVQYPDIASTVEAEMDLMGWLFAIKCFPIIIRRTHAKPPRRHPPETLLDIGNTQRHPRAVPVLSPGRGPDRRTAPRQGM